MKKIYVGNLSWNTSESQLQDYFAQFGPVKSCAIITDRETGRSRGFGFIEMDAADADRAIEETDGKELDGRRLRVNEAQPKRGGPGGGPRGGGGRY